MKRSLGTALSIQAGPKALAHIRQHGLRAQDIAVIPAAAGGPKGLILQALDQWLFGTWLPTSPRERTLIGSSIGAWRMAAACRADPVAAFRQLGELYCAQRFPHKPSSHFVTESFVQFIDGLVNGHEAEILSHPHHRLHILTARGRRLLASPQKPLAVLSGFALAVMGNLLSRSGLAHHLSRVVIADPRDPALWLRAKFDAFATEFVPLSPDNLARALLASGTLPVTMEPVRHIPHAPAGTYWDGGLIDYHLALPYSRIADQPDGGLVLYPHFNSHIVPGWFDKQLPWRRASIGGNCGWLDNLVLLSPSRHFLQTLSRSKLPDRSDYLHYRARDDFRVLNWRLAVGEGERLRDEFAGFVDNPDPGRVRPL